MLGSAIAKIVGTVTARPLYVIVFYIVISVLSVFYAIHHFAINTNITNLISADLPWRQRAMEMDRQFPHFRDQLVAVIDAATPEAADATAAGLAAALARDTTHFKLVMRPDAAPFLLLIDDCAVAFLLDELHGSLELPPQSHLTEPNTSPVMHCE